MYDTKKEEHALLIVVEYGPVRWPVEEIAAEFTVLAESAGIIVEDTAIIKRKEISPSTYIGSGKVEEIAAFVEGNGIDVVIFNNNLSFAQQRNLEDALKVKTIDRTQLILDIFALHARTQTGKLQVELAQLRYLRPRLKGKGVMLSRLGGGIGTRGPGETRLEADRRKLDDRITRLERDLEEVKRSRDVMRKKRRKQSVRLCSLVGYTSAGKTTLFNALTQSGEKTAASLFTTLDPVSHTFEVHGMKLLLSDTVGFISDLPPQLIEAFKSTLEELHYADILLHLVDASNRDIDRLRQSVDGTLKDLELEDNPVLTVFNKIDLLDAATLEQLKGEWPQAVFISAKNKLGFDALAEAIYENVFGGLREVAVLLRFDQMELVGYIHDNCELLKTDSTANGMLYLVRAKASCIDYLVKKGVDIKDV